MNHGTIHYPCSTAPFSKELNSALQAVKLSVDSWSKTSGHGKVSIAIKRLFYISIRRKSGIYYTSLVW